MKLVRATFSPKQFMFIYSLVNERADAVYQQYGHNRQYTKLVLLQMRLHKILLKYKKENKDEI